MTARNLTTGCECEVESSAGADGVRFNLLGTGWVLTLSAAQLRQALGLVALSLEPLAEPDGDLPTVVTVRVD